MKTFEFKLFSTYTFETFYESFNAVEEGIARIDCKNKFPFCAIVGTKLK